ncbi:hypothetical protein C8F01DRAFT_1092646 [Mycena amicta]|nr:hypothetical protein C8F01DRAFT_1092646 [Mycena amicta]
MAPASNKRREGGQDEEAIKVNDMILGRVVEAKTESHGWPEVEEPGSVTVRPNKPQLPASREADKDRCQMRDMAPGGRGSGVQEAREGGQVGRQSRMLGAEILDNGCSVYDANWRAGRSWGKGGACRGRMTILCTLVLDNGEVARDANLGGGGARMKGGVDQFVGNLAQGSRRTTKVNGEGDDVMVPTLVELVIDNG